MSVPKAMSIGISLRAMFSLTQACRPRLVISACHACSTSRMSMWLRTRAVCQWNGWAWRHCLTWSSLQLATREWGLSSHVCSFLAAWQYCLPLIAGRLEWCYMNWWPWERLPIPVSLSNIYCPYWSLENEWRGPKDVTQTCKSHCHRAVPPRQWIWDLAQDNLESIAVEFESTRSFRLRLVLAVYSAHLKRQYHGSFDLAVLDGTFEPIAARDEGCNDRRPLYSALSLSSAQVIAWSMYSGTEWAASPPTSSAWLLLTALKCPSRDFNFEMYTFLAYVS